MAHDLLAAACADWGVDLTPGRRALIDGYLAHLLEYNRATNLTAETDPEALRLRHVADGLAAAGILRKEILDKRRSGAGSEREPVRLLDLGSGGGFIGIAIKIAWPEAEVTLMESLERKYRFLNAAAARMGLKGLRVVLRRAGSGPPSERDRDFDAVTARALAPLPEALALGLPLAASDGLMAVFQSDVPAAAALALLPARLVKAVAYRLPKEEKDRHLCLFTSSLAAPAERERR